MASLKTLHFRLLSSHQQPLTIHIREIYSTRYSSFVWPSALVLSDYICSNWQLFSAKTVLELGSGTGICGIVLAKVGSRALLTDKFDCARSLELCSGNVALNNVHASVLPLEWGRASQVMPQVDLIIGSDCFYEEADFEDLLFTISLLFDTAHDTKGTAFYFAYQLRCSSYSLECLAHKWSLKCRAIPFKSDQLKNCPQVVEIYEIKRSDSND